MLKKVHLTLLSFMKKVKLWLSNGEWLYLFYIVDIMLFLFNTIKHNKKLYDHLLFDQIVYSI